MIDTQAIRNKILDLALRGKLTEQLPEDGTAEELFQQIQQEKQTLIKASKIKKEKPLPEITEKEKPFEIPKNWKWVRWGALSEQIQYGYIASAKESGQIRMVRISDIQDDKVIWENVPFCDIDEESIDIYALHNNDILFARTGGTVGKSYLVENVTEKAVFAGYLIRTSYSKSLNAKYIKLFMNSLLYWKQLQDGTTATAQPNCNGQTLSKMILPLPPFAEQQRIVEKLDSSFSFLDTIDALQAQYHDNLAVLKSKLIDAGIQGKLTEQLPEDGTAEELYQQIQQKKQTLEKAGKIKKSKPLPLVSDEEKPFEIPENWKWVSVGDVCTNIQYGTSKKSSETGKMPVIRMGNLQGGKIVYDKLVYTSDDNEIEKYPLEINDLLFNRTNSMELVGKTAIYKGEMPAIYAGYLVRITPLIIISDYLNYVMQSKYYWDYCRIVRIDANGQSNINAEKLKRFIFPLPPLAEQKRIVAKLEKLLPLCEG